MYLPIGCGIVDLPRCAFTRIKSTDGKEKLVRVGPRVVTIIYVVFEPFVEVSWEQVEKLLAEELSRVKNKFGNQAIFGGSYGWSSAVGSIMRKVSCIVF